MIPYEVDPSLHTAEPEHELLDDGFSPPHPSAEGVLADGMTPQARPDPLPPGKSAF